MTEIQLHIDEVVLRGFDPRQRHAIADALHSELARLMADSMAEPRANRLAVRPAEHRRLDGGAFDLHAGSRPAATGASLAAAIHRAIEPLLSPAAATESRDG